MQRAKRQRRSLRIEQLEQRCVMAGEVALPNMMVTGLYIHPPCSPHGNAAYLEQLALSGDIPDALHDRMQPELWQYLNVLKREVERPGSTPESIVAIFDYDVDPAYLPEVTGQGELRVAIGFTSTAARDAAFAVLAELGMRPAEAYSSGKWLDAYVRYDQIEVLEGLAGTRIFTASTDDNGAFDCRTSTNEIVSMLPYTGGPSYWYDPPPREVVQTSDTFCAAFTKSIPPRSLCDHITDRPTQLNPVSAEPTAIPPANPVLPEPALIAEPAPVAAPEPIATTPQSLGPLVALRIALTDLAGQPIDSISVGESFRLAVVADDIRESQHGVFASFVDVGFDTSRIRRAGDVQYPDGANVRGPAASDASGIRTAGATLGMTYTDGSEQLLFSTLLTAEAAGDVLFSLSGAAGIGKETLIFGLNRALLADEIVASGASLRIDL